MASATSQSDMTARGRLFGGNRMKLGAMAFNCSHGSTITTVPEAWKLNWADTVDIAQAVDRAGMEALLPVGRWRGYGGPSDFNCTTFESFTWASALGADQTRHRARHVPRAAGTPVDGGEDGVDHRSRHQRAVCAQCGLRLVQE
jgi:FMNH2-dependent dimethyl sulfone monooxygenase